MEDTDKKNFTSEYNEALNQLVRLHIIWVKCNTYSIKGELKTWKWLLDRAWIELYASAKKKDEEYITKIKELNDSIAACENVDRNKFYDALQEKEKYLRLVQEEVGKGGKMRSDDEDDIDT